jgi:hypothetical protein
VALLPFPLWSCQELTLVPELIVTPTFASNQSFKPVVGIWAMASHAPESKIPTTTRAAKTDMPI